MQPEASVVIPVWNAATVIGEQLDALEAQESAPPFEVVVADNGSTDGSLDVIRSFSTTFPLRIVDASDRRGPSHARNVGVRSARAAKILFCDADDVVSPHWVAAMAEALNGSTMAGGGLEVQSLNSKEQQAGAGGVEDGRLPTSMGYLPYCSGGNMGVLRESFLELGGFDESFRGHEEVDLSWRVQEAGGTISYVKGGTISYRMKPTTAGLYRKHMLSGSSFAQLYAKHRNRDIPRNTIGAEARAWVRLVKLAPEVLNTATRGSWVAHAGWMTGRLVGWLTYRVRPPL